MELRKVASQLKGLSSTRLDLVCIEALEGFIKPVEDFMARVEGAEIDGSSTTDVFLEVGQAEEVADGASHGLQELEHAKKTHRHLDAANTNRLVPSL